MKRSNLTTTTKLTDELIGKNFTAQFVYEKLNGTITGSVSATVQNNGKTFFVSKNADGNGQSINGQFDMALLPVIVSEIDAIITENTPVKEVTE